MREKLPNRRPCTNSTFRFNGMDIELQVGCYEDGRIAEVFLSTNKSGTMIDHMCRDMALALSIALQYGAPFETLAAAGIRSEKGDPEGLISVLAAHLEAARDAR